MPDIFDEIGLEEPTATGGPPPISGDIFDQLETGAGDIFDELTIEPEAPKFVGFEPMGEAFAEPSAPTVTPEGEDPWVNILGKSVLQATQVLPKVISEGGHIIRKGLDMPESDFRKSVKETERILALKTGESKAKEYVGGAVRTLGEMVGTGFNLPLLVSRAGTEKTTEALDEGRSMGVALLAGTGQGITEYVTEKIPFNIIMGKGTKIGKTLLKPAESFLGRLAQGAVTDVPGELLATFTEMKLINEQLLDKTYTDDELKQALIDTAAVAGLTTFLATGVSQPFQPPKGLPKEPAPEAPPVTPEEEVAAPPERDIFDELEPEAAPTLEELAAEVEAREAGAAPAVEPIAEPAVGPEVEVPLDYKAEISQAFPEADQEDISFIADRIAQNNEEVAASLSGKQAGAARSRAQAWKKFAETGEVPTITKGKRKGQPLAAFEEGFAEFEGEMRSYIDFKLSIDEEAGMSPRFMYTREQKQQIPKKTLKPFEEDGIFNVGELERRVQGNVYTHDRLPQAIREGERGTALEAAKEIVGRSLRTVPENEVSGWQTNRGIRGRRADATPIRAAEARDIAVWAVRNNMTIPDFQQRLEEESRKQGVKALGGRDNYVYHDKEQGKWFKANRFTYSPTFHDLFDSIALHNHLFPSAEYTLEGFSRVGGEVLPVFSQQDVVEDPGMTIKKKLELADQELKKRGFKREGEFVPNAKYTKGDIVVTDITADNVVIHKGKPIFIDPIIELNPETKSQRILGKQVGEAREDIGAEDELEGLASELGIDIRLARGEQTPTRMVSQKLKSEVDNVTKKWKNKPPVNVVETVADLPPYLRQEVESLAPGGEVKGIFDPRSSSVFIVSNNISSVKEAVEITLHEVVGHYGLRNTLGKDIKTVLNDVYTQYSAEANRIAQTYGLDVTTPEGRQEAAEEVLAGLAQSDVTPTALERTISTVRKWMRKVGIKVKLTDSDIRNIIADASRYVREGRKPGVVGAGKAMLARARRPEGKAGQVYDDIMEARETSLQKKKRTVKETMKKLRTSIVDVAGNTKAALNKLGPEGKKAVMRHVAYGGAHTKALKMADQATKEIYGGLTEEEHDYLDQYIYAKRHLEIASFRPDFKLPGGRTPAHMQALIDSIPKDTLPKIEERAEIYWATMDNQLQQLFDEGLLSESQANALRRVGRYYSPRVVLDYVDPMTTGFEGGKKITVPDSGIQRLTDEGTTKLIEGDTSLLLSQVISRTQSRIFKNRANQALWELAEAQPGNPLVRKARVIRTTKEGKPVYQPAPRGWEKLSVMIDGQQREMLMPTEFAEEWIFKDPILLHAQRNMIQWLTGTKILKSMATGLNPEFAFTNMPRDIALIWMSTEEYSPLLPKALGQIGIDIGSVVKDAVMRKGAFEEYIDEGGGMEFLTHQGRFASKLPGAIGQVQKVMGYLGETSEIMTRLALRNRAIKNGATPEEATIIARNYLDFTQGGNLAKAADSALPYLNAGIQATRGMMRAASTNPKLFSVKMAQVASIATMLYLANRLLNEDAWEEIPERDKVNNWIITTPYSYVDDTGTERHIYFRIAKDQGQRVFATIFENLAAKSIGDEVNVDEITLAVRDFIPFSPTNLPPTVEAILGYSANKDFWFNEDIWKGPEVRPEEEFTRHTPKAFVELGRATGLSPERTKSALEQLFTYGNIWTSLVGGGTKMLLEGLDDKEKSMVTEDVILKKPFVRKVVRSTDPFYKYGKAIEETGIEERTEKHILNRELDTKAQDFLDGLIEKQEVIDFVKKQSPIHRKRLVQRFRSHQRLKDIPDRRFWLELMQEPPRTRAYIFNSRWKQSTPEKRKELEEVSFRIPKFRGKTFNFYLRQLRKGGR